ncbi:MAG: ATP synthase F1 subunit gamma [Oscillospiraceae bacterium]|jgi:F-type H+-transporting ATPase subunit gamma|nr:ATP synthase F1 subunit gamma [Oscillospiraceae bacterium]
MAGGTMRDIRRRIRSVESTGQITKAMELVASSKLRRAKERAQSAAPYLDRLYRTICDIAAMNSDLSSEFVRIRPVKHSLLIVVAGDRGLAGGYNNNIFKLADAALAEKDAKVIAVGRKAVERYERRGCLYRGFAQAAENMDLVRADQIARIVVDLYQKGEVDEVFLYYTQFVSALTQQPLELKMLPLSEIAGDGMPSAEVEYEPSAEAVFDMIVPAFLKGMLYGGIVESFASEQGARRTAMESASDNAQEMIGSLSLALNRARQAAITQEITEIVGGANAQ